MSGKTPTASAGRADGSHADGSARRNLLLAVLAVAAGIAALHFSGFDWREVPAALERVNRPLALWIMATLPILGFPISVVYLAAGAIFGPWVGGLVVAAVTAVHLLATQLLARTVLRRPVERWRHAWSRRLPEVPPEENATLVAMIVIVPALPYLARNCLLALAGVPQRLLLGVALPLYVARSYTTIFLGNLGSDPSLPALWVLGGVYGTKLAISAVLFRRLQRRCRRRTA